MELPTAKWLGPLPKDDHQDLEQLPKEDHQDLEQLPKEAHEDLEQLPKEDEDHEDLKQLPKEDLKTYCGRIYGEEPTEHEQVLLRNLLLRAGVCRLVTASFLNPLVDFCTNLTFSQIAQNTKLELFSFWQWIDCARVRLV